MSSTVKFRAWSKQYKQWYYDIGPYVDQASGVNHNLEVQQFIGRIDKNDRDIYEGDIVAIYPTRFIKKHGKRSSVFVIEKDEDGAWGFEWHWRNLSGYSCSTHIMEDDPINYEVIGNVHENPEFLKPKRKVANARI